MGKTKWMKYMSKVIMIILYLFLFVAVIFLMRHVQNLLNSDVEINLIEVVTQNKDVITSKLNAEVKDLEFSAEWLTDSLKKEGNNDYETLQKVFQEYAQNNDESNIYISDNYGNAVFPDKTTINIYGRKYFKLAAKGMDNISDRIVSRKDGEDIFVISIPIKFENTIIGTIQRYFTPEEMYSLCSISLYSSEGYMYIINSEGYILIGPKKEEDTWEAENYFRLIYAQGNHKAAGQLKEDIQNNSAGFMETVFNGEKIFSAYTPIEDIHNWYLISSVDTDAVSSNTNIVIKMFYSILFFVVLILGGSLWGFLAYKNKQQENLKHIAFVDSVTSGDTYNKFIVDLTALLRESGDKKYYILKFDIDNFKYINNFYGFDVGDRILYQIYHSLKVKLLPGETIARVSSDNFVVLLQDIEGTRLNDLLDLPPNKEGITICFSAGLYTITDPKESINLMVDKASTAAGITKGSLHKMVNFYSEKFDQQMIHNEQMKRAIREALDNNEMIPYFQPKVDVNTGKMVGAEALARWLNPEGILIPPDDFVPLCEKTGLVTELDMMIFDKVLRFQRKNLDMGTECIPISVNFSRMHLLDKDFFDKISSKMHEYKIPPELIEIELTETAIFDNYDMITNFINKLHNEGFMVSMDDFGSGYSSLNMLKDISIDVLKIDKGFLSNTANNSKQRIIFTTIAQIAQKLDIKVVVEGVEISEHVELMREVGCSIAQGYFYSKPIDEDSFEKIYKEGI